MSWSNRSRLIFPKVRRAAFETARNETDVEQRIEDIFGLFFPDDNFDSLFDRLYNVDVMFDLVRDGYLSEGQYRLLVTEWFRADMLNGGLVQTIGNKGWLMPEIVECLSSLGPTDLAENVAGMMGHIKDDIAEFDAVEGDLRNSAFRKAWRKFSETVRRKMADTDEGRFLTNYDRWPIALIIAMLRYIDENLGEFCLEN